MTPATIDDIYALLGQAVVEAAILRREVARLQEALNAREADDAQEG
jgi:hypothetical protein